MNELFVPTLLACGPCLLSTVALVETFQSYRKKQTPRSASSLVGGAWLVSFYAAYVFVRYTIFPPAGSPPPWEDPEILDLAMLFFLAPIGIAFTIAAGVKGASRCSVIALIVSMIVLSAVGAMEGISV